MDVLGVLLPLALGVATSASPITVMLGVLLSPRGRSVGAAYLVGYASGLAAHPARRPPPRPSAAVARVRAGQRSIDSPGSSTL